MPTWGEILVELRNSAMMQGGQPDFDGTRRRYLAHLYGLTGNSTIVYYTDWLAGGGPDTSITLEDMQGMMEVCKDLPGPKLDLVLHTPGGHAEATAALVGYLRRKFDYIRVFVPLAAMSAGTMWSLAADEIVMGKHSQLGPIDPQIGVQGRFVPTRAILEQFDKAVAECQDPAKLPAWYPILQQYGPALLSECESAEHLSKRLVSQWLSEYMFRGDADHEAKAAKAASWFADFTIHRSHALGISRENARAVGIKVTDLELDQSIQDAVLSVHHATMHTFGGPAVKLIENHLGRAFVKLAQPMLVPMGGATIQLAPPGQAPQAIQFPPLQ